MKIYISGPMSGLPEEIWRANFNYAQKKLEFYGNEVVNPVAVGDRYRGEMMNAGKWDQMTESQKYEGYMQADLAEIKECEGIYLLKGWEKSPGAKRELYVALSLCMMVILQ